MNRPEFKPFPNIARFDESEPVLKGMPANEQESIFASDPLLAEVANLSVDYNRANSNERRKLKDKICQDIKNDPDYLIEIIARLDLLIAENSKAYPTAQQLKSEILTQIEKATVKNEADIAPERLRKWLILSLGAEPYASLAERVLTNYVELQKEVKDTVDVVYNLALAGMLSGNPDLEDRVMRILMFQTGILSGKGQAGFNLLAGQFDLDDKVLQKVLEIDAVAHFLGTLKYPALSQDKQRQIDGIINSSRFTKYLKQTREKDEERFNKLTNFYLTDTDENGIISRDEVDYEDFPTTLLLRNIGELRRWFNERMAQEQGDTSLNIDFPESSVVLDFPTHQALIDHLKQILLRTSSLELVRDVHCWQTIALLAPELSEEQRRRLAEINSSVVDDIREKTNRWLSPRGDLVEIMDRQAGDLGFKEILFEMDPRDRMDVLVTVRVGNYRYRLVLDADFSWRQDNEKRDPMLLSSRAEYIKYLILSHLRCLRCQEATVATSDSKDKKGMSGDAFSRRPHLRRLPAGQGFTISQQAFALERYGVDLVAVNQQMGLSRSDGQVTFVREVEEIQVSGKGPLKSRFDQAMPELMPL